jgi:hypothetical protein
MTTLTAFLLGLALAATLAAGLTLIRSRLLSFRAQRPDHYAGRGPDFDLRRHLSGPILCEGMIFGPTGRVTARFVAEMEGKWDGDRGTLTEHFRYDNGREQRRAWDLTLMPGGTIRAAAADLVGAGRGEVQGSAVRLSYRIRLDKEAGGHVLDVTDWMYLVENGTILNRSQFRKFGITVAELVATMRPHPAAAALGKREAA